MYTAVRVRMEVVSVENTVIYGVCIVRITR